MMPPYLSAGYAFAENVPKNKVKSSVRLQNTVFPTRGHLMEKPTMKTWLIKSQVLSFKRAQKVVSALTHPIAMTQSHRQILRRSRKSGVKSWHQGVQQMEDHVSMNGAAEWKQMWQHKVKKSGDILDLWVFVSMTVPGSQLLFIQPVVDNAGHLHDVGEVL